MARILALPFNWFAQFLSRFLLQSEAVMVATPKTLADKIIRYFDGSTRVSAALVPDLCQFAFYASLRTEEGQPITFHISYMDPQQRPDPRRWQMWTLSRFEHPLPFDIRTLVKVARSTDPRSTSLAVFPKRDQLQIVGIVDQLNWYTDLLNLNATPGDLPPGVFQLLVSRPGHLSATDGLTTIAELRLDHLATKPIDVFMSDGLIKAALAPGIRSYIAHVKTQTSAEAAMHLDSTMKWWLGLWWMNALKRVLLRVRDFQHGGAILITNEQDHLNVKYPMKYDRLAVALREYGAAQLEHVSLLETIKQYYNKRAVPTALHKKLGRVHNMCDDSERKVDSASWAVSLLTRVDGLVLMSRTAVVRGFGVKITESRKPKGVCIAGDAKARVRKEGSDAHLGTRHGSMMRYCSHHPGAVGFVISQDGDVRAMTNHRGQVVMWEDIHLQYVMARYVTGVAVTND